MKTLTAALSVLAVLSASALAATDESALAKEKLCFGCHALDKKMVGPSFKEISARYAGKGDALDAVAGKIRTGGTGAFGNVPMPPNPTLAEADAKRLAAWILGLGQ